MTVTAQAARLVDSVLAALEGAQLLDPVADAVARVVPRPAQGMMTDTLSGVPVGHPLHPALVAVPIGAFCATALLDWSAQPSAARTVLGMGLVSSVPAAACGLADWLDTTGAERRVGLAHLALNVAGLGLIASSWLTRRQDGSRSAAWLSLAGLGVIGVSGWLGGHLTYAMGVGVDTTAFQLPATTWTDAVGVEDLVDDQPALVTVHGMGVMVVRRGSRIVALANRCTHRGGPLDEGTISDGSIECPWHGSRFDLADGSVTCGPATRPVPTFATRVIGGRVQVRRDEPRSLRRNPAP